MKDMLTISDSNNYINDRINDVKDNIELSVRIINQNYSAGLISKVEYLKLANDIVSHARASLEKFLEAPVAEFYLNQMFV